MDAPRTILIRAHLWAVLVVGVFMVALPLLAWTADPWASAGGWPVGRWLGPLVGLGGAALSYASFWTLVTRGRGTAFPTDPPVAMVVEGPYRWLRNPMYLGNLAVIGGSGLAVGSPLVLVYCALLAAATDAYVRLHEEPVLRTRHGATYDRYGATVARWMPHAPLAPPERALGSGPVSR
jgi:protein-S-isoprenylcysteine O-methyltransferase Ste14